MSFINHPLHQQTLTNPTAIKIGSNWLLMHLKAFYQVFNHYLYWKYDYHLTYLHLFNLTQNQSLFVHQPLQSKISIDLINTLMWIEYGMKNLFNFAHGKEPLNGWTLNEMLNHLNEPLKLKSLLNQFFNLILDITQNKIPISA